MWWMKAKASNLQMEELAPNIFLLEFSNVRTKEKVLKRQPWNVKGFLMVVKILLPRLNQQEVDLNTLPPWVQLYGVRLNQLNEDTTHTAGGSIGEVLKIEGKRNRRTWYVPFLRVQVLFYTLRPLPTGYDLKLGDLEDIQVFYKFERVSSFCYVVEGWDICNLIVKQLMMLQWNLSMDHGLRWKVAEKRSRQYQGRVKPFLDSCARIASGARKSERVVNNLATRGPTSKNPDFVMLAQQEGQICLFETSENSSGLIIVSVVGNETVTKDGISSFKE